MQSIGLSVRLVCCPTFLAPHKFHKTQKKLSQLQTRLIEFGLFKAIHYSKMHNMQIVWLSQLQKCTSVTSHVQKLHHLSYYQNKVNSRNTLRKERVVQYRGIGMERHGRQYTSYKQRIKQTYKIYPKLKMYQTCNPVFGKVRNRLKNPFMCFIIR